MKLRFHLDPPPSFQGLRNDLPLEIYERFLPHWRQEGATYFVTFRLHDSLPIAQQAILRETKQEWERRNPPPHSREQLEELNQLLGLEADRWLDTGFGCCVFRSLESRCLLRNNLGFFDLNENSEPRYELGALVIMPNHVHLLVRPLTPGRWSLETILQSWKRHSSRTINRMKHEMGRLWMPESHDRIVRDSEHLWKCLQYIGRNGRRARLRDSDYTRWVRPEWEELGWRFDDDS